MRKARNFYIALCLVIMSLFSLSPAYGDDQEKLRTYVVYNDVYRVGGDFPIVTLLVEYLGHFGLSLNEMPLSKWTPGSMADADLIVYVGLDKYEVPKKLLAEIARAKRVIWFESNIEQMANYLGWKDFQLDWKSAGWLNTNYKQEAPFYDWQYVVITSPGKKARVLATISNAHDVKPLVWQRDNIYFCGILNFDPNFSYILADLLHELVPNDHTHPSRAFLRIEDVNPQTPPKAVKEVVNVINKHRIPFAIGVVPVSVTANGSHIYLHQRPDLVKVLRKAQDDGASIIMHGYTHQNIYSPTTGEGYEFWNARDDKPMEDDENFTRERIRDGIAELVRSGLTPLAFEPPHYAMSKTAYNVLSEHFNIFSGQIQLTDKTAKMTGTLPYITRSTYLNGMLIIPENAGYYDGSEFTAENLLENSARVLKVQDGLVGFFYHGYLPAAPLDGIIKSIKEQGYEFLDLRQLQIKVQSEQITITGTGGNIEVSVDEQLKASWHKNSLTPYVAVFVLIIVTAFIIIRLRSRAGK